MLFVTLVRHSVSRKLDYLYSTTVWDTIGMERSGMFSISVLICFFSKIFLSYKQDFFVYKWMTMMMVVCYTSHHYYAVACHFKTGSLQLFSSLISRLKSTFTLYHKSAKKSDLHICMFGCMYVSCICKYNCCCHRYYKHQYQIKNHVQTKTYLLQ